MARPGSGTDLERVAAAIGAASAVVALTGAGISAESGVPTFRGPGGLWRSFRVEDLATPEAFAEDPQLVWEWYRWRRERVAAAEPNPGHRALAALETRLPRFTLLTQNVDGLHRRAGSRDPVELHGNIWRARCAAGCGYVRDESPEGGAGGGAGPGPPRCACGAWLRPDVVWFGEALDPRAVDRAAAAVEASDVMLVVGTSAVVYPVAALPSIARRRGAIVVEVNVAATPFTPHASVILRGAAGEVLPALERLL